MEDAIYYLYPVCFNEPIVLKNHTIRWLVFVCIFSFFKYLLIKLGLLIFIVITLCIAILLLENDEENKNTSIKVYSVKILNILIFLMETILTIPILQVLLITFSNDPKYGLNKLNISIYYCCITSASFSLFFLLVYSIFYSLFFI